MLMSDKVTPADDYRELVRLAQAAITAGQSGGDWHTAYHAHWLHYEAIIAKCNDPIYRAALLAASKH
jgi:hypothetical protein